MSVMNTGVPDRQPRMEDEHIEHQYLLDALDKLEAEQHGLDLRDDRALERYQRKVEALRQAIARLQRPGR